MVRNVVIAVAALAAAPLALQAQLPETAAHRIEAAKVRVAQANIPVQLIESKISEGRARGASEDRIAAAAEKRATALTRAQEAMAHSDRDLSEAELAAGANAVEAGVDAAALRAVIKEAQAGEGPVALSVLTELQRQGLPVDRAVEAVTAAMQRGGDALANLPAQAAAARERGGRPDGIGGGRPAGAGAARGGVTAGAPAGIPTAGQRPGAGTPGGKPAGTPTGRP